MSAKKRLELVFAAISDSESGGIFISPPEGILSGFSGEKLIGLLQRLAGIPVVNESGRYLEVGVFQGMTLLSTAFANPKTDCYGIDNFSKYDVDGKNEKTVRQRGEDIQLSNYKIVNEDFESALINLDQRVSGKISTYFIDGPHDYRSQLLCLIFSLPHLTEGATIVIDDCNYAHVRQATYDFLVTHPNFKLIFEAYTPKHPYNMNSTEEHEARAGWWDGVHVLVHDPDNLVEGISPPVPEGKDLYYNDHVLHSMSYARLAAECTNFVQAITRPWRLPKAIGKLLVTYAKVRKKVGRLPNTNTYSEHLTTARIAKLKS